MKKADEENFEEASAQAYRVWTSSKLPEEIVDLFEMLTEQNKPQSPANAGFYVLLTALKRFTELKEYEGLLPLTTTLPDMKSDTQQSVCRTFFLW
jgi:amyloid beta precursor protein binding protein 1